MKLALTVLSVVLCLPHVVAAQATQPAGTAAGGGAGEGWQPIFNGRDLTGWYTFLKGGKKNEDPTKIFQVQDGVLHIYKDAAEASTQPFGYACTEAEYGDCRVRLQYKWGTKRFAPRAKTVRDSGLLYFVVGDDKVWPQSVECQVQENDVGDLFAIGTVVGSTVDPATAKTRQPKFQEPGAGGVPFTTRASGGGIERIVRSEMLETDGWNTVEVVLKGDTAVHIVNGKVNMRLDRIALRDAARTPLSRGKLVLQAEGAEVMFRNVEVRPLTATETAATTAPATQPASR